MDHVVQSVLQSSVGAVCKIQLIRFEAQWQFMVDWGTICIIPLISFTIILLQFEQYCNDVDRCWRTRTRFKYQILLLVRYNQTQRKNRFQLPLRTQFHFFFSDNILCYRLLLRLQNNQIKSTTLNANSVSVSNKLNVNVQNQILVKHTSSTTTHSAEPPSGGLIWISESHKEETRSEFVSFARYRRHYRRGLAVLLRVCVV